MMITDADIDTMRERMAVRSPLGAIAHRVWGEAGDPAWHERLIRELVDPIRAWIISAAGDGEAPQAWDERLLVRMAELVAKAMIEQHEFTEEICRASCLAPSLDEKAAARVKARLAREGLLDPEAAAGDIDQLVQAGLLVDSGQRRNGEIVWIDPELSEEEHEQRLRALVADREDER
jgi:hypothetical protein